VKDPVEAARGQRRAFTPIAVVGVSALFPGSLDKTGFWRDILAGKDLLKEIPETHWLIDDYYDADPTKPDKTYAKRGAFLDDVPFDPMEWGIPPSIVPQTDTTQLLALIVAKQVLDDATRGQFASMDRSRTSCILGVTSGQELMGSMVARLQRPVWVKALRESGMVESEVQAVCDRISASYTKWEEAAFPGLLGNVVAGRIANRLDIGGTNCVTDAACASTFSALSMAVNELALGQSDLVIAGGCDTMNDIFMYMCFSKTPALSPSGDCRPFSDKADGTMLGEGLGMLALKRLEDAERDGDRVYAVIRGIGSSSDGKALSVYAPLSKGQAKAIERCYESAGFGPETVELVEAHGTGTKAGDAAEFEGLKLAFAGAAQKRAAEGKPGHVVRARQRQEPDRPHEGGRWRGEPREGGARGAPRCAPADDQGRQAEPEDGDRGLAVLPEHRGAPVGEDRRSPAPCGRVVVRLRRHELPRRPRAVRGPCRSRAQAAHEPDRARVARCRGSHGARRERADDGERGGEGRRRGSHAGERRDGHAALLRAEHAGGVAAREGRAPLGRRRERSGSRREAPRCGRAHREGRQAVLARERRLVRGGHRVARRRRWRRVPLPRPGLAVPRHGQGSRDDPRRQQERVGSRGQPADGRLAPARRGGLPAARLRGGRREGAEGSHHRDGVGAAGPRRREPRDLPAPPEGGPAAHGARGPQLRRGHGAPRRGRAHGRGRAPCRARPR
jgi:3-oxoacyl-(acyl-carrier-protein) synthase